MLGPSLLRPGDSQYYTAHNNYMDFVLLGGVGYMVVFVGLCISVTKESLRVYWSKATGSIGAAMLGIALIYITASMFTGGLTYQPALATLWWTFVGFAWRSEVNRRLGWKAAAPPGLLRFRQRHRQEEVVTP